MGIYLNPSADRFKEAVQSEIYVDKSGMIAHTNAMICTKQKYICISRPRRFGKTMSAEMLAAYYVKGTDTSCMFDKLHIASDESYRTYLNRYNVININIQQFLSKTNNVEEMLILLQKRIIKELRKVYGDIIEEKETFLSVALEDIYSEKNEQFIFIIDEWDCILREKPEDVDGRKRYLDFLRDLLKDQPYVALAYMTGILPIKKYGTHSALNMFDEYSMLNPGPFAKYVGFTEDEVKPLCEHYGRSYDNMAVWYDGYSFKVETEGKIVIDIPHIYNPKSVVQSLLDRTFASYWSQTETYEALKCYIDMDMDGLQSAVAKLLAGEPVAINPLGFQNDMTTLETKDDVLTLLVHLGYLSYNAKDKTVSIPNHEIRETYLISISGENYASVADAIKASDKLLTATLNGDTNAVSSGLARVHMENSSILKFNDENSLRCAIALAYYTARRDYTIIHEMPAGKGYADLAFIPKPGCAKPAMIIELKYAASPQEAIRQIKSNNYSLVLEHYRGNLLLVGVNYNDSKEYDCVIEHSVL